MAYDKIVDSAKLDGAMTATADAIRGKTGKSADIPWNESTGFASEIASITTETEPNPQAKTATPSTSAQTIKPDSGYDGLSQVTVNAMPTATQATPSIAVTTGGLITASTTQTAGYVAAGTKSATKQLTTQAAKTVTPSTSNQTAVASGKYTTGAITVKGDANLKAANILKGVSIFGVAGSLEVPKVATGSFEITDWDHSLTSWKHLTVSGLPFKPSHVKIFYTGYNNANGGDPTWGIYAIDANVLFVHNDPYYDEDLGEDVDDWCFWHALLTDAPSGYPNLVRLIYTNDGFEIYCDDDHEYANELRFRQGIYEYVAFG
jgi:hypothetical protein